MTLIAPLCRRTGKARKPAGSATATNPTNRTSMVPDYKPRRHQRQVYEFAAAAAPRRPIGHHSPELQRIHAPLRHEPGKCAALRAPPHLGNERPAPFSPEPGQPIPLTIPRHLLAVAGVGGLAGHP